MLRPILEGHRLSLISGWYSGRLMERSIAEEMAAIEEHSALLAAMGCAVLVYAEMSGSIAGDRRRPLSARPHMTVAQNIGYGLRLRAVSPEIDEHAIAHEYRHEAVIAGGAALF